VERLEHTVGPGESGKRLDRILPSFPAVGTRARGQHLIERGLVLVDGQARKAAFAVRAGMRLSVTIADPGPVGVEPEDIPLAVLYADEDVVVVDKQAGLVVQPAPNRRGGTLVNALLHHFGPTSAGASERPGIVHRLDKDTSGVMVVARTPSALESLARQFRARSVEKLYLALAHGRLRQEQGELTWAVGRHPRERTRMSVASRRGRAAQTHFRVLERLPGTSLLALSPRTGRTHQLRVHLAAFGHPLVGDRTYGTRRPSRGPASRVEGVLSTCPRQALHAHVLAFDHPRDGRRVRFEAALPPDLGAVLDALRALGPREDAPAG
jgi:23S rRNA pseudouridine1911/1915/1917 synthase